MAKATTKHIADMAEGLVPSATRIYTEIRSAEETLAAVAAYDADTSRPFAAVANAASVKMGERIFRQYRFRVSTSDGDTEDLIDEWRQLNATNFPTMNINAYKQAEKAGYDHLRTLLGLDPL